MKILNTPQISEKYATDRLFGDFVTTKTPQTLLIEGGVGSLVSFPSAERLRLADAYFLGGHRHELTDAQVTAITAAGFSEYIEDV